MARKEKPYFDDEGRFILRPYRMKDLAAIYGVSTRTIRRWLDKKVPDEGRKNRMFYTIEQVKAIITGLGIPQKIAPIVTLQTHTQAA